jgi:hypothetical protein
LERGAAKPDLQFILMFLGIFVVVIGLFSFLAVVMPEPVFFLYLPDAVLSPLPARRPRTEGGLLRARLLGRRLSARAHADSRPAVPASSDPAVEVGREDGGGARKFRLEQPLEREQQQRE